MDKPLYIRGKRAHRGAYERGGSMQTIAIIAQKGGTGKTTTAHATGAGLAGRGYKVLLIDADAQGNLTYAVGADNKRAGTYEILTRQAAAADAIQAAPPVDILTASPSLALADLNINQAGREYRMREALQAIAGRYDYCIIDTPPALGTLTVNALTAASTAVITAQADIFSLQAIGALSATIEAIRQHSNPGLTVGGILLTRYNPRTIISRDMMELLADTARHLDTKVYAATIREATALKEAQAMRQDIYQYNPNSNAAADYTAFIGELLGGTA